MTDNQNLNTPSMPPNPSDGVSSGSTTPPPVNASAPTEPIEPSQPVDPTVDPMADRINRLSGEPAPDISPEEFARLQQMGEVHLDPRGRIRERRRESDDPGVSVRKRRAWYAGY